MAEQIKKDDIASADVFANIIPTSAQLKALEDMDALLTKIAKTAAEQMGKGSGFQNILNEAKAQEQLNEAYQQSVNVGKQKAQVQQQMNKEQAAAAAVVQETDSSWRKFSASMEENARVLVGYRKQLQQVQERMKTLQAAMALKNPASAEYAKMNEELVKLTLRQTDLKTTISEANIQLNAQTKEMNAVEGSMNKASQQLGQMRSLWRNMTAEEKNSPFGQNLLKQIKEIDGSLKKADGQIGNFQRNVGDYANGFKEALGGFQGIGNAITSVVPQFAGVQQFFTGLGNVLPKVAGGLTSSTAATGGLSVAMKVLRVAIASTGIGLLVIAVASLIAYFTRVQEGSDKLQKVFTQIGMVIDVVMNRLAKMGEALVALLTFDWDGFKNGMSEAVTGLADAFQEAWENGSKLADLLDELEDTEGTYAIQTAALEAAYQRARIDAEDASISAKQRLEYQKQAQVILEQLMAAEKNRLYLEFRTLQMKAESSQLQQDEIEAQKKYADYLRVEADYSRRILRGMREQQATLREINKEAETAAQNRLDALANKQYIERLKLEQLLLQQGKDRADIDALLEKKEIEQMQERLALLNKLNAAGALASKLDKEIEEVRASILRYNAKILEDDKKREENLQAQYEELKKQEALLNFDAQIATLDKNSKDYIAKYNEILKQRYELQKKWLQAELDALDVNSDDYFVKKLELTNKMKKLDMDYQASVKDGEKDNKTNYEEIQKGITSALENQIDKRIALLDKEKQARENQLNYLQALAANGNITARDSIQQQIEMQRKLDQEREKMERRKANLQAISSGLQIFQKQIETGKTPAQAFASTITSMKMLEALLKSFNFFYTGTDSAPEGWAVVDERGAELHTDKHGNVKSFGQSGGARFRYLEKGDKIVTAEKTQQLLQGMTYSGYASSNTGGANNEYNQLTLNELKAIRSELSNRDSITTHFDQLTNAIVQTTVKKQIRTVKKYRL